MRSQFLFLASAGLLVLACAPLEAADLSRIDRSIGREPTYGSSPRYCLLALGPEASKRVWLVVDGNLLFVDRNGNSDLTEPGEKVVRAGHGFPLGEIVEADGMTRHPDLQLRRVEQDTNDYWTLTLARKGKLVTVVGGNRSGYLRFGDNPQNAPVVHVNGPLTLMLPKDAVSLGLDGLTIRAYLGTRGLGEGANVWMHHGYVPGGIHPVVEVEFPNRNGGPPVKVTGTLRAREC